MNQLLTKYGILHGVVKTEFFDNDIVKECTLDEKNTLHTKYGDIIPQYDDGDPRRKHSKSLSFHKNGILKSVSLQNAMNVNTGIGTFSAELITFYQNDNIERIFPSNSKITGYWTEENEYELAQQYEFRYINGTFNAKVICIRLFDTGELRGLTLWTKERIKIKTSVGLIDTRIGVNFYPNGAVKSLEPARVTEINTSIGIIKAFDPNAIGVTGDVCSLNFNEDGSLKSLKCSNNNIKVTCENGDIILIEPGMKQNLFNNKIMDIIPFTMEFYKEKVVISSDEIYEFDLNKCTFEVLDYFRNLEKCGSCENCNLCK